ncbi:MAG: hypothetical protein WC052_04275 [Patescibacteria group bacterium]
MRNYALGLLQWLRQLYNRLRYAGRGFLLTLRQQPARRLLPIISGVVSISLFEFVLFRPDLWAIVILLIIAMAVTTGIGLMNTRLTLPGWWHTLITPALLGITSVGLLLFLPTATSRQVTIILVAALFLLFWENIWRYYWDRARYHDEALENISLALNTAIIWFFSLFAFNALLDATIFPGIIASNALLIGSGLVVAIVFFIDYRTIWVQRYNAETVWLLQVSQALILGELFWVTNFLPHSVEVKSFLLVLAYYLFTNIGRSYLDGTLRSSVLRRYLYLGTFTLLAVFITANWFV